jgi:DNA-binding transcriptional ArsR family regulator
VDDELDLLLGTAIDSLVKVDVLLHLHSRPGAVRSAQDIAAHLRRPERQVSSALDALSQAGLADRFPLGTGRHVVYGATEDEHVREIIALLHERYRRPETRGQVVRAATRGNGPG